jgi:hypothetical protein
MERLARLAALVLLLSSSAVAQVLDFDAVCGTPPCAIGTLYSASGVGIAPDTTQIVAAGTNGLTGVNGGRYLSVATFPYQVTATLARQATFASITLSRANTSSATVIVQVTALRSGSPVGNATATLTSVNTWSTANLSIIGGFDSLVIAAAGGANLTFGIDNLQFGGTCGGFTDVSPLDNFCNATEWLANRLITLGCAPGQYCPGQSVSRAAMALLLQRLGTSLAPAFRFATGFLLGDFQTAVHLCETTEYRVIGSPRVATAQAAMIGSAASALKVLSAQIAYSTDGGATWTLPGASSYIPHSIDPNRAVSWMEHTPPVALESGQPYRFAVRVIHQTGYGPTDPVATARAECELLVRIENANPSTAPFDPASAAGQQP